MLFRSVIDKYARIGEGAEVGLGERPSAREHDWLEGLTLIGKDASLPPGVRVGRAVVVGVGVKPDAFPGREVASGTVIANRVWQEELR